MEELIIWVETLAKLNPMLEINFNTSGVPSAISPADDVPPTVISADASEPVAMDVQEPTAKARET